MPARVGRRRIKNLNRPAGVRERGQSWYFRPTSARDRAQLQAKGARVEIYIGPAGSLEARKKWAELTGRAAAATDGTLNELCDLWQRDPAGLPLQANGNARAESTVEMYVRDLAEVRAKFGRCYYGKTEAEAAAEQAIGTVLIQEWADAHPHKGMLKRQFAVLDNVFAFGIRRGRTTYNPCADVALSAGGAREREVEEWERECLRALAGARMGLMMDFEAICGWRIGDVLALQRAQGGADGVRVRYRKQGKRWVWDWSPELRRIWSEAEQLPGATRFPASPVFPSSRRTRLSYAAFDDQWQVLKNRANVMMGAGVIDPDTLDHCYCLVILDLHFHDLRSKAHDDAEDAGIPGNEFLGNSRAVSRRHYHRRRRQRPLK
jgi:integrase